MTEIVEHLAQHIESLIFVAENPITLKDIKSCLDETFESDFREEEIIETIQLLTTRYEDPKYSFEIVEIANGYQFLTKGVCYNSVATYLRQSMKKRLSRAALETLSIIAYKQPVTKGEIEKIRGVNCDYAVQKLLEKELLEPTGRSEGPGRPLLYGTSQKFMDYFGIKDLGALPKLKDFKNLENEIGEVAPIEENAQDSADYNSNPFRSSLNSDLLSVVETAIAISEIIDPEIKSKAPKVKPTVLPVQASNDDNTIEKEVTDLEEVVDIAIAISQVLDPKYTTDSESASTNTLEAKTTKTDSDEQVSDSAVLDTNKDNGIAFESYTVLGATDDSIVEMNTQESLTNIVDTAIAVSDLLEANSSDENQPSNQVEDTPEEYSTAQTILPDPIEWINEVPPSKTEEEIVNKQESEIPQEPLDTNEDIAPSMSIPIVVVGEQIIEREEEEKKEEAKQVKPKVARISSKVIEQIGLKVDIEILTEDGQTFSSSDEDIAKVESSTNEAVSDDEALNEEAQGDRIDKLGDQLLDISINHLDNLKSNNNHSAEE